MALRLVLSVGTTVMLAVVAAACGQDASESAGDRGARLFGANCASCHADDLGGTSLGPSLLTAASGPGQLDDEAIHHAIRNGVDTTDDEFGAMPANAVLSDTQIDEIIAYVRGRQREVEPVGTTD